MTLTDLCAQPAGARPPSGVWPSEDLERVAQCPVCGSPERSLLHDHLTDRVFFCAPGVWTLYTCCNCGSAYLDPRPTRASIGRAYAQYFTHARHERAPADTLPALRWFRRALANGYRNWKFGTRFQPSTIFGMPFAYAVPGVRESLDVAFRYMPKPAAGARLLDVGAGNGDFLDLARSAGWRVQGVDPDPEAVAVCRGRSLDVRIGSIEQFAEEHACFDYITISHVIEHVHDPQDLLRCAFGLLKRGGSLYVDTPNIDAIGHKQYGDCYLHIDPPRHLVLFNWRSLERAMRDAGFTQLVHRPQASVYAEAASRSRAIRDTGGDRPDGGVSLRDRLIGRALAARILFTHQRSEFVTLLARKADGQR